MIQTTSDGRYQQGILIIDSIDGEIIGIITFFTC